jgi:hypothetical protein
MRKAIMVVVLFAGFAAMAFAKPAAALPSSPTIEQGQSNAPVLDVGYKNRNWHGGHRYRGGYAYGYRPYYRPYGYYRPYYGYGYPYYRRPGISLWFGF